MKLVVALTLAFFCSFYASAQQLPAPFINAPATVSEGSYFDVTIEPVDGATEYQVYVHGNLYRTITDTKLSFVDWGATNVKPFKVKACNTQGCSEFSNEAIVGILESRPETPNFVVPEVVKAGEPFCLGVENGRDELTYKIRLGDKKVNGLCTTLVKPGYETVWGKACEGYNCSWDSGFYRIGVYSAEEPTPLDAAPYATSPAVVEAGAGFDVNFTEQPGATYYEVFIGDRLLKTTTELKISEYSSGGFHKFKVRACNDSGCGEFGNVTSTLVKFIKPRTINIKAPKIAFVNERYCLDMEEQKPGFRYYTRDGDRGVGICRTHKNEGIFSATVTKCWSHYGCSHKSSEKVILAIPKLPDFNGAISSQRAFYEKEDVIELTFPTALKTSGQTWYEVYESDQLINTVKASPIEVSYTDAGEKIFRVKACNSNGCSDFSEPHKVTVKVTPPVLQPLDVFVMEGNPINLTWTSLGEEAEYKIYRRHLQGSSLPIWGHNVKIKENEFTYQDTNELGRNCFAIGWYVGGWASGITPEVCTSIRRPIQIDQQIREVILIQNQQYQLHREDFSFTSQDAGPIFPARIMPGDNYMVSEDGLSLIPDVGFFGKISAQILFRDNLNIESEAFTMELDVIDARPTAITRSYEIDYQQALPYIAPYNASNADPRGLPIVKTEITRYARYGSVEVYEQHKLIKYESIAAECLNAEFFEDSFEFTVTNSEGFVSAPATISIKINCPVPPNPVATGDLLYYKRNGVDDYNIMDNPCNDGIPKGTPLPKGCVNDDYDPYGLSISMGRITQTTQFGYLNVSGGAGWVIYVPFKDSCRTDWFFYTVVNDAGLESEPKLVRLECAKNAPEAFADQFDIISGQLASLPVLDNDINNNGPQSALMALEINKQPTHGTATISSDKRNINYQFTGDSCEESQTDSFEYRIIDGEGVESVPAVVSLNINCIDITWSSPNIWIYVPVKLKWDIGNGFTCSSDLNDLQQISGKGEYEFLFSSPQTISTIWECVKANGTVLAPQIIEANVRKLLAPANVRTQH